MNFRSKIAALTILLLASGSLVVAAEPADKFAKLKLAIASAVNSDARGKANEANADLVKLEKQIQDIENANSADSRLKSLKAQVSARQFIIAIDLEINYLNAELRKDTVDAATKALINEYLVILKKTQAEEKALLPGMFSGLVTTVSNNRKSSAAVAVVGLGALAITLSKKAKDKVTDLLARAGKKVKEIGNVQITKMQALFGGVGLAGLIGSIYKINKDHANEQTWIGSAKKRISNGFSNFFWTRTPATPAGAVASSSSSSSHTPDTYAFNYRNAGKVALGAAVVTGLGFGIYRAVDMYRNSAASTDDDEGEEETASTSASSATQSAAAKIQPIVLE